MRESWRGVEDPVGSVWEKKRAGRGREFGSLGVWGVGRSGSGANGVGRTIFFVWCVASGTEVGREVAEWELRRRSGTEGGEGGVGLGEESGRSWGEGCVGSVPRTIFFCWCGERGRGCVCEHGEDGGGDGCVGVWEKIDFLF